VGEEAELLALRAANRRVADDRNERRMVALRAALFTRRDRGSLAASDAEAAPVTGAGFGLPTIGAAELDVAALKGAMASHGALRVRGLLSPDRIAPLRAAIDAAIEAQEVAHTSAVEPSSPWFDRSDLVAGGQVTRDFVRSSGGAVLAIDSPRGLYQILENIYDLGLDELVAGYFGERPALSAEKTALRRQPPGPEMIGWHQDGRFLGAAIRSLNLWVALTDCPDDAPGLEILPTRLHHILPTGTEGALFEWTVSPRYVDREFPGACIRPDFIAGDAILFDHFLLHRTWRHPQMKRPRYALESWFFAPSAYPDSQTGLYV
jgi:phytanoyl-CoA dioxygenase PhyH